MTTLKKRILKEIDGVKRRTQRKRGRMPREMRAIEDVKKSGLIKPAPYRLRLPFERDIGSVDIWACADNADQDELIA